MSKPIDLEEKKIEFFILKGFKTVSYKSISFDIPAGIPHEGKGENSWDMGMDATFGISFKFEGDLHDAREKVAMNCLKTRQKYGSLSSGEYAKWKEEREAKLAENNS